jgi:hypothetical protein
MRRTVGVLAAVLVVVPAVGACGADRDDRGPGRPAATPSTSAPASALPEEPTLTAPPDDAKGSGVQRYAGVVERSPEDRCTTLTSASGSWVLTGTVAGLSAGDRVTVVGRLDPDATSTCQRGPVLVVVGVERS